MPIDKSICEEQHFHHFYNEQAQSLRNFLYYKCGNLSEAEDLMQESFIRVWAKCKEVIFAKAKSFLYTVSNRLFIDQYRKAQVSLKFEKSIPAPVDTSDPYYLFRTDEFRAQLEEVISGLPDGQREAFLLNRIDKHSYKEIASMLDISETAVEKRISKALIKLRDKISELKSFKI